MDTNIDWTKNVQLDYTYVNGQITEERQANARLMSDRIAEQTGESNWCVDPFESNKILSAVEVAKVLEEVNGLCAMEREGGGAILPSVKAMNRCMDILLKLIKQKGLLPPSDVVTDVNGDIRISWRRGLKEVELVSPSDDEPAYLYFSLGDNYGVSPDANSEALIERLRSLYNE